jgi:hypothetical protein
MRLVVHPLERQLIYEGSPLIRKRDDVCKGLIQRKAKRTFCLLQDDIPKIVSLTIHTSLSVPTPFIPSQFFGNDDHHVAPVLFGLYLLREGRHED